MTTFLMTVIFIFLAIFLLVWVYRMIFVEPVLVMHDPYMDEEEVVTTTTTTTTVHSTLETAPAPYVIHGTLTAVMDGGQRYVLDPVDNTRWYLNSSDDMYEDAEGKIWQIQG